MILLTLLPFLIFLTIEILYIRYDYGKYSEIDDYYTLTAIFGIIAYLSAAIVVLLTGHIMALIFPVIPSFIGFVVRYIIALQYKVGDSLGRSYYERKIEYINPFRLYIITSEYDKIYFPFYTIDLNDSLKNNSNNRKEKLKEFVERERIKKSI